MTPNDERDTIARAAAALDDPGVTREVPAPRAVDPAPGQVWRHHSGRRYTVLFLANDQGDGVRVKYPVTVVYQGENGRRWAGPLTDWHRRMTFVAAAPQPAPMDREALVELMETIDEPLHSKRLAAIADALIAAGWHK